MALASRLLHVLGACRLKKAEASEFQKSDVTEKSIADQKIRTHLLVPATGGIIKLVTSKLVTSQLVTSQLVRAELQR